eukprot:15464583-Heterocapsa_arctica.AAC.1
MPIPLPHRMGARSGRNFSWVDEDSPLAREIPRRPLSQRAKDFAKMLRCVGLEAGRLGATIFPR